jgi:heme/copper-type cytochrome/quinol oxidase subunit 2
MQAAVDTFSHQLLTFYRHRLARPAASMRPHDRERAARRRARGAHQTTFWLGICAALLTLTLLALVLSSGRLQAQEDNRREVSVAARHNGFNPARLEVHENDLIKVTFTAEDAPHSFNIDEYRIAKRARPGHPAVFEFRADRTGKFAYYCTLAASSGAHDIRGELVVLAR